MQAVKSIQNNKKGTRILKKGVSAQVVKALRKIVNTEEGTAKFANVPNYEIGGKTGTADQPKDGSYSEAKINTFASSRMRRAQQGLEELRKHVDTIIVIPNQNLFKIANEQTTFEDSFNLSNNVLMHGVQSITDLMVRPGLINLDFALEQFHSQVLVHLHHE